MPYRAYDDQNCSIAGTLAIVGERWTLLILREVLLGRRRFREIQRHTGVASNILADRLETMVRHGILRQTGEADSPEYRPTRRGVELNEVLLALLRWGDRHLASEGPPRVVYHTACDHDMTPVLTCGHCGEPLRADEVKTRPGPGADHAQRLEGVLP